MVKVSGLCLFLAASAVLPTSGFVAPLPIRTETARAQQRWADGARSTTECRGRSACSALSMTAGAMGGDATVPDLEEGTDLFASLRPLTEGPIFNGLQAVFVVALAGLVDAGFSGDWQARGYLSDAAADTARTACLTAAAAHVVLTGAAGFIAKAKGEGVGAAMVTLATGPLGFLKVAAMPDQEELEAIAASKAPPLSMVINTLELSDRQSPGAVVLSTSIKAKKGREGTLRNLLESLVKETVDNQKDLVFTCTVNQDPEDRTAFFMLQRFPSPEAMSNYQNTDTFQSFTDGAEECIAEPMGLYMVNERSGKLGEPVHPFGPGGEGGRDDAIYSSPANLQGSLVPGAVR
ncbi:unnamed protein product [Ectocarpus sp. CCAP 1310/34]|nr:unnamed protein product [Ectocarpus sp. CCAP 1310/34]